jgi:hypothetical protein
MRYIESSRLHLSSTLRILFKSLIFACGPPDVWGIDLNWVLMNSTRLLQRIINHRITAMSYSTSKVCERQLMESVAIRAISCS